MPVKDFERHSHDFSELFVIFNGSARHVVEHRSYPVSRGDAFVIKGECAHEFTRVCDLEILNIQFFQEDLILLTPDVRRLPGFQCLFILDPYFRSREQFESRLVLSRKNLLQAENHVEVIRQEMRLREDGFIAMVKARFLALVVFLSRLYHTDTEDLSLRVFSVARAVTYMERHFLDMLSLEQVAGQARLSTRQFSRLFKANYHASPMEYVQNLRLNHAERLLANHDLTISEIAYKSGFSDSNYFTRVFKKRRGISPGTMRKSMGRQG